MKKRMLSWILTLVLVAGISVNLAAADTLPMVMTRQGDRTAIMTDGAVAMPCGAGTVSAPTGHVNIAIQKPRLAAVQGDTVSYESDLQVLAKQLRQAMVARQETVALYVQTSSDTDLKAMVELLIEQAVQETGAANEGDYLRWQYDGWDCGISRSESGGMYYLTLTYQIRYYTTYEQEQEVTRLVSAAVDSFGFDESTTDYQKVQAVYEYIAAHTTYDYAHLEDEDYKLQYTAYAALVNGTSVCQGYANLLYRMLGECGVPCRIITGVGITDTGSGGHAWNIVQLNGVWYNVDLTWDDAYQDKGYAQRPYFLRGSGSFDTVHIRDSAYTGSDFTAAYPTSQEDYAPTECDRNGHQWSEWTVDVAPTYSAEGQQHSACGVCGAIRQEVLPVLPAPDLTNNDLTALLRHVAKIEPITDEDVLTKADFDHSGSVDAVDVTMLAQALSMAHAE